MNRRSFLQLAGGAAAHSSIARPGSQRPNIIVIMADDMGYSDIGCYGSEVATPNLDRMAKGGVRFTHFANSARCCPTRASLLTGLYSHQAGVGHMVDDKGLPGYRGQLSENCVTVAEALRSSGYRTAMSGKWHVSRLQIKGKDQLNFQSRQPFFAGKNSWPLQRGFEKFYGTIAGVNNFFDPFSLVEGNELAGPPPKDYYYTDAITDRAVQQIDEMARTGAPFFQYIAYTAPHWPMQALESDIARYSNRYRAGWDALRQERHRRMIELGVVDRKWRMAPREPGLPAWADASNKEWEVRRMAVYAAMIDRMDQGIGRIMNRLKLLGKERETLVLFLSDNGACAENVQPVWYDIPTKTRDGRTIRIGNDPSVMAGSEETWLSYGPAWANASNTPFRSYKHWVYEGGIATPFIAHWPGTIQPDRLSHEHGHVIDIMPTCLDAAGSTAPSERNGVRATPMEGRSLLPVLKGGRRPIQATFWEHEGNRAIREGQWKLVASHGKRWELYNLVQDRTELTDLSAKHPDRVSIMSADWDKWAARANVLPWDQVRKTPAQ